MRIGNRTAIVLLALAGTACQGDSDSTQSTSGENRAGADRVLTGGRIYTVNEQLPWVEAVAIKGDRFIYVGDTAGAREFVTATTEVHDLGGRMAIPGLIDGHTHPGYIDLERYGGYVSGETREAFLAAVRKYADAHPDDEWIRLCCWPNELYVTGQDGPHKRDLDAIVPDRPVWITSAAWHSYWLNSAALEKLGVDRDTPDPGAGIATYVRDEQGELTGWVKEGAGWQHLAQHFPVDPAPHKQSVEAFLETLGRHGVTTVYDAGNFEYSDHVYGFLAELDGAGRLPLRYEGTYAIYLPERRHVAISELKRLRDAYGGERLRFNTIKLFMDGITENRSGGMLQAYSDAPGTDAEYRGNTLLSADELRDFLLQLHAEKLDLHVHAIGDLAVRTTLDGVEAARAVIGAAFYPRVTIGHLEIIDPADWPRFAELEVSANYTLWWLGDNYSASVAAAFGADRTQRTYTANALFENGANVTFSSDDWRLDVLSPFLGMQTGHTRRDPEDWITARGGDLSKIRPPASEKLPIEKLLSGYTKNGAYPFRMEQDIGTIETGKYADLVVLDENLFEMNASEITNVKPIAVMMEGEVVHGELP